MPKKKKQEDGLDEEPEMEQEEAQDMEEEDEQPIEKPIELTHSQLLRQKEYLEKQLLQVQQKERTRNFLTNLPEKFAEMEAKIVSMENIIEAHNDALQMFKTYLQETATTK